MDRSLEAWLFERHSQATYVPYELVCFELPCCPQPLLLNESCMPLHLLSTEHPAIGISVSGSCMPSPWLSDQVSHVCFELPSAAEETGKIPSSVSMCTIWEMVQWQLFQIVVN